MKKIRKIRILDLYEWDCSTVGYTPISPSRY